MFLAPEYCDMRSHTEFSCLTSAHCVCHYPAHLRNPNSPALLMSLLQPSLTSGWLLLHCRMWQAHGLCLTGQVYSGLSWSILHRPEPGICPMGTTVSHYPGPGPSSASNFFPSRALGRQENSSHSGKPLACSSSLGLEVPAGRL